MANVIVRIRHEPAVSCYMPQWRAAVPGRSFVEAAVSSDGYGRFCRLWCAVRQAIAHWDHAGRPLPAHPDAADRAFLGLGTS